MTEKKSGGNDRVQIRENAQPEILEKNLTPKTGKEESNVKPNVKPEVPVDTGKQKDPPPSKED